MAAVIPEAAEAVTGGESAVQGAGAAARARPSGAARSRGRASAAGGLPGGQQGRRARRTIGRARVPGGRNYQPVILAEFLVAVLVVALAPIAKGGTDTAKAKGSPSPYDTSTLKQILIIGLLYFILALLSSGKSLGRFSAWFGGLILVAVGITQTVNGGLAAVLKMFGLDVGSGLGTFPASGDSGSLLPGLNLNVGQFAPGALASGVQGSPSGDTQAPSNPTSIFPTIEPGGTIVPGINLQDSGQITTTSITAQSGGTGVIDNAPVNGVNLA